MLGAFAFATASKPPWSRSVTDKAVQILDDNRLMTISTIRDDGWPQSTVVGYANEGLDVYFVIFRGSQKFANIARNDHVSIVVFREPADIRLSEAVYAGAVAGEVTDSAERDQAWSLLVRRHPNLMGSPEPDWSVAALMRARLMHLSVLDYSLGLGHSDALHVTPDGAPR